MRGRRAAVVTALASLVLASGCVRPAFTLATRERHDLSSDDLSRIQFYTSGELVLRREVAVQRSQTGPQGLVLQQGETIEEVVIPAHTPGVVLRADGDFLLVGFAPQRPDLSLWFGVKRRPAPAPQPLEDLRYELVHLANGPDDPTPLEPRYHKGFLLSYGGHDYRLADRAMWQVHLLYDEGSQVRQRVRLQPPGWHVSDRPAAPTSPAPDR